MSSATLEDQLVWERRARALLEAVVAASARGSVETVLAAAVAQVCDHTGWPVGHVLVRDLAGDLVSMNLWHMDDEPRYQRFREISAGARFPLGVGLPGRVLATGRPAWILDVTSDPNFPRSRAARDLGVTSGFAFPVVADTEVQAVLEFFSPRQVEPDAPFFEVMAVLGLLLGRALERARAEQEIRASEMRFRSVAATAQDAVIVVDDDGRVMFWNRRASEMFGWAAAEIAGEPLSAIIPERYRARHDEGMRRVRAGGEPRVLGRTVQLDGVRRDGTEFPVELSLATFTANGRMYYTGIIRDVSERRAQEARLREAAERLEISERRAVEASRAKSLFLASMSHELRTPLNTILGFAQLLQRDERITGEQRDDLGVILRSGEHLLDLINDVLSLSKIEAGASEARASVFDPDRLVRGLRDMFHPRTQARGVHLSFVTSDLPPRVYTDGSKLRQVLINLLGNAVKFCERGSITVRVTWATERAKFEVEDTGRGIPAAELPGLFEPFRQAEAGIAASEGAGLGLAISRDHVRLLGGELEVTSELGKGTTFHFEIPLPTAPHDAAPAARARVTALAAGQSAWRVLVVDNDGDNRRLLARLVERVGFAAREAADGEVAIELWREWAPHFIWMDMRMPVLDGYEATKRIRAAERAEGRQRCAIVALTASAFEHDRPAILAVGCDAVIAKPFHEAQIFEELARRLGVKYVLDDGSPEERTGTLELAAVPAELLAALAGALTAGDDGAALEVARQIATTNAGAATELTRRIRAFDFDSILAALERGPA